MQNVADTVLCMVKKEPETGQNPDPQSLLKILETELNVNIEYVGKQGLFIYVA